VREVPDVILGVVIKPAMMLVSGTLLLLITLFQFLQGKRIIKFKGALHRKIHARVAGVLVVVAALHGLAGAALVLGWGIS
jgi:hypothetical protein